jgi:multimeric flavodoxin WrbA
MEEVVKRPRAMAVNGSPRKEWNTAKLLRGALDGAKSVGAETDEIVNLYDLNFKGCVSCFSCKLKEGGNAGRCAARDGLSEVLERALASDVLLLGSPIYLWDVTGEMRSFLERLLFPNIGYRNTNRSEFKGRLNVGFIYTMNVTDEQMESSGYSFIYESHLRYLALFNGSAEYITATDTCQFNDYSKYNAPMFDPVVKAKSRAEKFPKDCERAFKMGARLAGPA